MSCVFMTVVEYAGKCNFKDLNIDSFLHQLTMNSRHRCYALHLLLGFLR